jgi:Dimerisation domain
MSTEYPTPEAIIQLTPAYAGSKALVSAVELRLFTTLADGPLPGAVPRAKLGLQPRGTVDWLDALVSLGMLERDGDRYANTAATDLYLDRAKPRFALAAGGNAVRDRQRSLHLSTTRLRPADDGGNGHRGSLNACDYLDLDAPAAARMRRRRKTRDPRVGAVAAGPDRVAAVCQQADGPSEGRGAVFPSNLARATGDLP